MSSSRDRYPLNAPGDFYVVRDQCIICMAPEHEAPDLMGFFDDPDGTNRRSHCYFKQQPQTAEELRRAIAAVHVSCCRAVRYGGDNPDVVRELLNLGDADSCDASGANKPLEPTPKDGAAHRAR
jgi:hypothetical protein